MSVDASRPNTFQILWRAFLEQFVANESATSDLQTRRALIGIFAFLVTPGFFLMMRTVSSYELILRVAQARNMPELVERHLAQLAMTFVVYSMVTTALITVFIWDALVFDKRDAMVLGPLPIRGTTIVWAKLAALATFLLGTSVAVNLLSGVPFGFVTGGPEGKIVRHLAGHLAGTLGGAVFMFSALVVARGALVLAVGSHIAATVGSTLQFVFMSAVLLFMVVPATMGDAQPVFLTRNAGQWIPTTWFFALFETLRGSQAPGLDALAWRAVVAVPTTVVAAIAITFAGYWNQMRAALAPPARAASATRLRRGMAGLIVGSDHVARGVSDLVLTVLARSRPHQVPIAIAASLGVAIASVAISTRSGGLEALRSPRTVVLWVPIVLGYWIIVGLRASFVMPTELPAAWAFRVHSRLPSASHWSGVRAAMFAFAIGPALATNALVVLPLLGWRIAAIHAVVVCVTIAIAAQCASMLVDGVPFTRAYPPGHARLKTRWPLYLLAMYAVAYFPVQLELDRLHDPLRLLPLFASALVLIGSLEVIGRRKALTWELPPDSELSDDPEALTFLNIGPWSSKEAVPNS